VSAENPPIPLRGDPPLHGVGPQDGFQSLAQRWKQVAHQREHCEELLMPGSLIKAIDATFTQAPSRTRKQGFRLAGDARRKDPTKINEKHERSLEDRLLQCCKLGQARIPPGPVPWLNIVQKQVPLYDTLYKAGWDKMDLFGLGEHGLPVVIELKKGANREPPLRALLEAAAYGVALRKVWPEFRPELIERLKGHGEWLIPIEIEQVLLVVAAPGSYWAHWRKDRCKFRLAIPSFRRLTEEFTRANFPVSLIELVLDPFGAISEFHSAKLSAE
jgi:hypothetical protein